MRHVAVRMSRTRGVVCSVRLSVLVFVCRAQPLKLELHNADTDTDTDILARMSTRMSVSVSVSVSASWYASLTVHRCLGTNWGQDSRVPNEPSVLAGVQTSTHPSPVVNRSLLGHIRLDESGLGFGECIRDARVYTCRGSRVACDLLKPGCGPPHRPKKC